MTCPGSVEPSLESVILSLGSRPSWFSSALSQDPAARRPPSMKGRSERVLSCVRPFATPRTVVHQAPLSEILQARILEWVAISSSGDLSHPGIGPSLPGRFFTMGHLGSPDGRGGISNPILLGRRIPTGERGTPEPVALKGALSTQQHPGLGPFRAAAGPAPVVQSLHLSLALSFPALC